MNLDLEKIKRLEPNTNDNPRDVVVWDC